MPAVQLVQLPALSVSVPVLVVEAVVVGLMLVVRVVAEVAKVLLELLELLAPPQ
jgi:dihydrodipicolinate reductase